MMDTPPRKIVSSSKTPQVHTGFGWGPAVRFVQNGFGLRGKYKSLLDRHFQKHHAPLPPLKAGAHSNEIAHHLLHVYRVRQAVEETLEGLVYLIDDLKATDDLSAQHALSGLCQGTVSDAVFYYRQHAENKATGGDELCRTASDYFTNEAVLIFMENLPAALKAGLLATQSDPSHKRAWEVYGTLQMCCGQFTAAEQSFARAQALTH